MECVRVVAGPRVKTLGAISLPTHSGFLFLFQKSSASWSATANDGWATTFLPLLIGPNTVLYHQT